MVYSHGTVLPVKQGGRLRKRMSIIKVSQRAVEQFGAALAEGDEEKTKVFNG